MKPRVSNHNTAAMTLVEVLVVIAVLGVLAALLLPALTRARHDGPSPCVQNLKQVEFAFVVWHMITTASFRWKSPSPTAA
jgi:prepilin-type N-terminal cleavage/methylation domain-containing protein